MYDFGTYVSTMKYTRIWGIKGTLNNGSKQVQSVSEQLAKCWSCLSYICEHSCCFVHNSTSSLFCTEIITIPMCTHQRSQPCSTKCPFT